MEMRRQFIAIVDGWDGYSSMKDEGRMIERCNNLLRSLPLLSHFLRFCGLYRGSNAGIEDVVPLEWL